MLATEPDQSGETTRLLSLEEFESVEVSPDDLLVEGHLEAYPEVVGRGYFRILLDTTALRLQAQGFVGVIPINDRLTIEVRPRVPVSNFSRLLEVSEEAPSHLAGIYRQYETAGEMYPSLAAVLASALREEIELIASRGIYREYVRKEYRTGSPSGRVSVGKTVNTLEARGIQHEAVVSRFERSVDNNVNRTLLYAVWRLSLYAPLMPPPMRNRTLRDLNAAHQYLNGVHLDWLERFLNDEVVTGREPLPTLRSYYRPALDLALLVTGRKAIVIERSGSHVRLPSVVVSMSSVFESYLRNLLTNGSSSPGLGSQVLDGNQAAPHGGKAELFEAGAYVEATPDIVIRDGDTPVSPTSIVIEVKYKPASGRPTRSDLNQAITYGFAYGANHVVLAQPKSASGVQPVGLQFFGSVSGLDVWQYVFDLNAANLQAEENRWSEQIEDLSTP